MKRFAPLGLAAVLAISPLAIATALAQQSATPTAIAAPPAPAAATPAANPADVATIDSTIAALYDVISGPAGKPRDWNRMRSLFMPDARMMVVATNKEGAVVARTMTVEDYIVKNGPLFAKVGFFETERARTTETFGQLAHVFSTYEARHATADAAPFARGINSIQLYNDGKRWWVISLAWRGEDDKLKLPERYLQSR